MVSSKYRVVLNESTKSSRIRRAGVLPFLTEDRRFCRPIFKVDSQGGCRRASLVGEAWSQANAKRHARERARLGVPAVRDVLLSETSTQGRARMTVDPLGGRTVAIGRSRVRVVHFTADRVLERADDKQFAALLSDERSVSMVARLPDKAVDILRVAGQPFHGRYISVISP